MAYRLKDYLYNDKLTKEQNILMDRLYKLRMSGMAEAFEKQLLEPNTGLEPFEVRFAAIEIRSGISVRVKSLNVS